MDQRQIARFIDVVDSGSLTSTSQRLNVSQPALSKSLRQLEDQLGTKLLERGPRGVRVTKFGEVFCRRARAISAEFRKAREELENMKGSTAGRIALGVTPGPGVLDRIVPEAISRVAKKRSALKFTVRSGSTSELISSLNQGDLDILFTVLDERVQASNLVTQLLFEDHFVIVVRRRHELLMANKSITLDDLITHQWVLLQDANLLWGAIESMASGSRITPKAAIESNSVVFVRTMVSRTDSIGILPSHSAQLSEKAGELVILPLEKIRESARLPRLIRPMGLVHMGGTELTSSAQVLLKSITTVCRELGLGKSEL